MYGHQYDAVLAPIHTVDVSIQRNAGKISLQSEILGFTLIGKNAAFQFSNILSSGEISFVFGVLQQRKIAGLLQDAVIEYITCQPSFAQIAYHIGKLAHSDSASIQRRI